MNSPDGTRNRLLALLSPADRDLLTPAFETIDLEIRQILETPGHFIDHVYFVESGLVSVVGTAPPNHRIEIGMIGYEGMSGLGIVLGDALTQPDHCAGCRISDAHFGSVSARGDECIELLRSAGWSLKALLSIVFA